MWVYDVDIKKTGFLSLAHMARSWHGHVIEHKASVALCLALDFYLYGGW